MRTKPPIAFLLFLSLTSVASAQRLEGDYVDYPDSPDTARVYRFKGDRVQITRKAGLLNPAETLETTYKIEAGQLKISAGGGMFKVLPIRSGCIDQSAERLPPACKAGVVMTSDQLENIVRALMPCRNQLDRYYEAKRTMPPSASSVGCSAFSEGGFSGPEVSNGFLAIKGPSNSILRFKLECTLPSCAYPKGFAWRCSYRNISGKSIEDGPFGCRKF